MSKQPLWKCPRCGRRFANRNQSHWCAPLTPLSAHFKGKSPAVRRLCRAFVAAVRQAARSKRGSVKILSEKSCIGFQARITFATIAVQKSALRGHLVLARPVRDQRFLHVLSPSPRNHIHDFRLTDPKQLDHRFRRFLAEAYAVGQQEHLRRRKG